MKILIIEDERELAKDIANYLSSENYHCEFASTYDEANEKITLYDYDCIVLDLMLPGGNGLDILTQLKAQNKEAGVIILSAKNALEDKISGLKLGADDYLAKPFNHAELSARIFSIIRRKQFDNSNLISLDELQIDLLSKNAWVNAVELNLTKKEFDLLLYFIGNKNKVISKGAIAEHLNGDLADLFDNHDFVYAHVKNLKMKLTKLGYQGAIKTIYGTGYKWEK